MALVGQNIPKIGLVMEAVKIVRWLKNVGDTVVRGEPVVEVESEKSIVEIEAAASGRLQQILVAADQEATVGDRIAWIDSSEAAPDDAVIEASSPREAAPQPEAGTSAPLAPRSGDRILSTPVARRVAAERGVDLGTITGSGPRGRIQLEDVERAMLATPADGAARHQAPAPGLAPMRRALARAMTLSNATVPQFFVERSVDWSAVQAVRADLLNRLPPESPKPSINDFLLQAVARELIQLPALNGTFSGDPASPEARIIPANGAHIGLVVAVANGLLVPVLHAVERLGILEIARQRADCVDRALQGHLKRTELEGATISISNLGARGPDRFSAIINPPQSAILAVGRQRDCLVATADKIVTQRPMSVLTLTVDHRVADGRLASEFLASLVERLEGRDWQLD